MNQSVISIRNLCIQVGAKTILTAESLNIAVGEIFVVLGPNGAGKTTLLKTCLGFQRPKAGEVQVLGAAVYRLGSVRMSRLRRRIGYVPQVLAGRSEMPLTVREVVAIGRTGIAGLLRPLRRRDWQMVDRWIKHLGLEPLADQRYGDISGGEQRKTLIARAMAQQPELLLLDEPTANLDLAWREQIVATLQHLYEQTRVTVVLVCHELEVIPKACRRLLLLIDGRVSASGRPEDVLTPQRVVSLYGPSLSVLRRDGRYAVIPAGRGI
ncbi:MAG: ATP-binding cassette domain-containing protein [Actinobacteria bacterium]|nr:ATP-binding cassette domain-containing protein [Actinomycetota bacterium]